jgi:hypothetical protein
MLDSDGPRSPFAGMADLSARTPLRVLSRDEIERLLAEHQLSRDHGGAKGQTEMEWEEALLMAWGGEMPPHPRPTIGGKQLEPGGARKERQPRR